MKSFRKQRLVKTQIANQLNGFYIAFTERVSERTLEKMKSFHINNKDTRPRSPTLFLCLYGQLWTDFTPLLLLLKELWAGKYLLCKIFKNYFDLRSKHFWYNIISSKTSVKQWRKYEKYESKNKQYSKSIHLKCSLFLKMAKILEK